MLRHNLPVMVQTHHDMVTDTLMLIFLLTHRQMHRQTYRQTDL